MKIWLKALILLLVIALLGTSYYFVLKYDPDENGENEEPLESSISLFSTELNKIAKIEVKNPSESYAFVKSGDKWVVEGRENVELNQSKVASFVTTMSEISALKEIETHAADLSKYGLDSPQAELNIFLNDGTQKTFFLGNLAADGSSYYFMQSPDPDVYTVYNARGSYILSPLVSYRPLEITSFDPTKVTHIIIENDDKVLEVETAEIKDEMESRDTGALWRIIKPFKKGADNDYLSDLILEPASALTADDIVADNPQNMEEYGFGKVHVSVTAEGGTVAFSVGRRGGNAYIMIDGKSPVYKIPAESIAFVDTEPMDVAEKFAAIYNLRKVDSVTVKSDDVNILLAVKHSENEENNKYTMDKKAIGEDPFKSIYQKIIGLTVDGVADKAWDKSKVLCTVEYKMTDGSVNRIEIYPYDDMNVAVSDGVNDIFYMKEKKLKEMTDAIKAIKANPKKRVD